MAESLVLLAAVVATVAALVSMSVTLLLYYFCFRQRHDKAISELEPLQDRIFVPTLQDANEKCSQTVIEGKDLRGDVKKLTRHNVEDRILQKQRTQGSIKIKSPSLKTRPIPTQVEIQVPEIPSAIQDEKFSLQFSPPFFKRQESVMGDGTKVTNPAGRIHFSVEYDFNDSTLIVRVIESSGLPPKDATGTSDPYVRVTLLPDKKLKLETKVRRKTLNPRWNESLYFENFPPAKLQSRVLHLRVLDHDRFSRDDPIGETNIVLAQVDLTQKLDFWKTLQQTSKLGELLVGLTYQNASCILTVTIMKARNLKAKDLTGSSDPYVKVWLSLGDKKVEKKKTRIVKTCLNPMYDESFEFVVPFDRMRSASLIISVMDHDTVGRNETIGKVILATKSGPTESKHWSDMMTKPKTTIAQWHQLMAS